MTVNPFHIFIVLVLGVLFFGKNLPVVARQIGSALIEFRKGLNEWKDVHGRSSGPGVGGAKVSRSAGGAQEESEERFESLGTKFEPPADG